MHPSFHPRTARRKQEAIKWAGRQAKEQVAEGNLLALSCIYPWLKQEPIRDLNEEDFCYLCNTQSIMVEFMLAKTQPLASSGCSAPSSFAILITDEKAVFSINCMQTPVTATKHIVCMMCLSSSPRWSSCQTLERRVYILWHLALSHPISPSR